jgi:hypothetical protein
MQPLNNFKYLIPILLFISSWFFTWFLFGEIFVHPNQLVMVSGGDSLKIYFDAIWQTKWGSGFYFDAMNYPYKEVLPMSGGQAFLGYLFSVINTNIYPIHQYTVGICNVISLNLLPIGVVVSYKLLKRLHFHLFFQIAGAILLIYFSPLIWRIACGHINLGYPIFIPLVILWCLNIYEGKQKLLYSILLFLLLFILGFNNSYFIIVCALFIFFVGVYLFFFSNKNTWYILLPSGSAILVLFFLLKSLEIVSDRVGCPWGFSFYTSGIQALLVPQIGITSLLVKPHFFWYNVMQECLIYIGFLAGPILLFSGIYYLKNRKKQSIKIIQHSFFKSLLASAILIFMIASGVFFQWNFNWVEEHFPFAMQFRTSGRLAWPMFYIGLMMVMYCMQWIYNKWVINWSKIIKYAAIIFVVVIWVIDCKALLKEYVTASFYYRGRNEFAGKALEEVKWKSEIPLDSFQAIYILPVTEQWVDKLNFNNQTRSLLIGLKFAYQFHKPLVNAALSRLSYGQCLQATQFCSTPLIYKNLLDSLPNQKPFIIICEHGTLLSEGEEYIRKSSKYLFTHHDGVDIYAFYPHQPIEVMKKSFDAVIQDSVVYKKYPYLYYSFETDANKNKESLFGNSCIFQKKLQDEKLLFTTNFAKFDTNATILFSFWTKSLKLKYGNAVVKISITNKEGYQYYYNELNVSDQKDVYKGWILGKTELGKVKLTDVLQVKGYSYNSFFDSFLIQNKTDTIAWKINDTTVFYNNYLLTKYWK